MSKQIDFGYTLSVNVLDLDPASSYDKSNPAHRKQVYYMTLGLLEYYQKPIDNLRVSDEIYFTGVATLTFTGFGYQADLGANRVMAEGIHPLNLPLQYVAGVGEYDYAIKYSKVGLQEITMQGFYDRAGREVSQLIGKAWNYYDNPKFDLYAPKHNALFAGAENGRIDDAIRWLYALHNLGARAIAEYGASYQILPDSLQWTRGNILGMLRDIAIVRNHAWGAKSEKIAA